MLRTGARSELTEFEIIASETLLHLRGYGMVKIFKLVTLDGDVDYYATNDLNLSLKHSAVVSSKYRHVLVGRNTIVIPPMIARGQVGYVGKVGF